MVQLIGSTLAFGSRGPQSRSWWGRKIFLFCCWFQISWLPFTFKLIHGYEKWSIHELTNPPIVLLHSVHNIAPSRSSKTDHGFNKILTWFLRTHGLEDLNIRHKLAHSEQKFQSVKRWLRALKHEIRKSLVLVAWMDG